MLGFLKERVLHEGQGMQIFPLEQEAKMVKSTVVGVVRRYGNAGINRQKEVLSVLIFTVPYLLITIQN